jgi:geranylgeranyl pyrophosphate synthase
MLGPLLQIPPDVLSVLSQIPFEVPNQSDHPVIESLINRSEIIGGKLIRPTLCIWSGLIYSLPETLLYPPALCAEWTHAATLIHDDVIDNETLRRNKPTLNSITTNCRAVLSGDVLLARVISILAKEPYYEILKTLSLALEKTVYGEWLQHDLKFTVQDHFESIEKIAEYKTASLFTWAMTVGPILAKAGQKEIEAFHESGRLLGIAFQMLDDTFDFETDLKEGYLNYVGIELVKNSSKRNRNLFNEKFWTDNELENAKLIIQNRAQEKIEEAIQVLNFKTENSSLLQSLKNFFLFIGKRRY